MRKVLAAVLLVCVPSLAAGQTVPPGDREAVVAAVQKFVDAMAAGDIAGIRAVTVPEGRFFSLREGAPGEPPSLRTFTNQESADQLAADKRKLLERIWNPEVKIQGAIAVVWTPYDFWIDGKFSHCGVDAFNLIKTADGWKLAGGLYTVEATGCPPSPLGPPK